MDLSQTQPLCIHESFVEWKIQANQYTFTVIMSLKDSQNSKIVCFYVFPHNYTYFDFYPGTPFNLFQEAKSIPVHRTGWILPDARDWHQHIAHSWTNAYQDTLAQTYIIQSLIKLESQVVEQSARFLPQVSKSSFYTIPPVLCDPKTKVFYVSPTVTTTVL